ncbi:MAG: glutathione S-transferase family protein [Myxococcales bacterium]|nr:glutathione S-transferase family protein [Myxococcales bacterium]
MLKLFYIPNTRASRVRWMLEELAVPYELARIDWPTTRSPDYLDKVHPLGAVPALQDGDSVVIESAAIIAHLADKFPDKRLAPPPGERGAYYQWIVYAMATLEPLVVAFNEHTRKLPEGQRISTIAEAARRSFGAAAAAVVRELEGKEWILGRFTAADVVLGSVVNWAAMIKIADAPALVEYAERIRARPAWQKARRD